MWLHTDTRADGQFSLNRGHILLGIRTLRIGANCLSPRVFGLDTRRIFKTLLLTSAAYVIQGDPWRPVFEPVKRTCIPSSSTGGRASGPEQRGRVEAKSLGHVIIAAWRRCAIGFGSREGCRRGALRHYYDSSSKRSRQKGSRQTVMVVTRDSLLKVELHSSIGDFWACHEALLGAPIVLTIILEKDRKKKRSQKNIL